MKKQKMLSLIMATVIVCAFAIFALGSTDSTSENQGSGKAETEETSNLGDFEVVIDSCRLAKDYEGKDIVIVKYIFTNNGTDAQSFDWAFEDQVYQNGVGLNECYVPDDSANYSSDNQTKEIKQGATLDVEIAYELNDKTSDIEVEVSELISFNDSVITKTFSIA